MEYLGIMQARKGYEKKNPPNWGNRYLVVRILGLITYKIPLK